jgi:hypothetical protein
MHVTVYYLVHKDTGRKLKWYRTLAGARIAQRARNARLGFTHRVERVSISDNWEAEQCVDSNNSIVTATYCIVEDVIDNDASGLEDNTNG